MRHGGAVGAGDRHAPAGAGVLGGGRDDASRLVWVEQAPAAGLAGSGGPAEQVAGRDDEVDQRGQRRRRLPAGRAAFTGAAVLVFVFALVVVPVPIPGFAAGVAGVVVARVRAGQVRAGARGTRAAGAAARGGGGLRAGARGAGGAGGVACVAGPVPGGVAGGV